MDTPDTPQPRSPAVPSRGGGRPHRGARLDAVRRWRRGAVRRVAHHPARAVRLHHGGRDTAIEILGTPLYLRLQLHNPAGRTRDNEPVLFASTLEPTAADRAQTRNEQLVCALVTLETVGCFAIPMVTLAMGTVYSPVLVASAFGKLAAWRPLAEFVLGWLGVVGIWRLLNLVWERPRSDPRPWLTLSFVGCGCAASLLAATAKGPGGLVLLIPLVFLPMVCALHLVALNRRSLFL